MFLTSFIERYSDTTSKIYTRLIVERIQIRLTCKVSHRGLLVDLRVFFFSLLSFNIIITATPHKSKPRNLCWKYHTIPPATANNMPRIPIDVTFLTNLLVKHSYGLIIRILSNKADQYTHGGSTYLWLSSNRKNVCSIRVCLCTCHQLVS